MKQLRTLFFLSLPFIFSFASTLGRTAPLIIPRSQSVNAARELVGWQQFINRANMECTYGALSITGEYGESFKTARLLQCLFGSDITFAQVNGATSNTVVGCSFSGCYKTAQLAIQGSCVTGRTSTAWLADYFGLPTDFSSVITFKPRIQTALGDFNYYLGLDEWAQGVFFRIHAPVVWTKWNLCASEYIVDPGSNGYQPGYMSSNTSGIANAQLRHSFLRATDGTYTWGDMQSALKYGKFTGTNIISACADDGSNNCANNTIVRLADVEFALGYNFFLCDNYHLGLEIRGSAPAGNKPCNLFVFEPIVGNGKFGTLGFGITGHAQLWQSSECEDRSLNFYLDANISHLFKNNQMRTFDIDGLPNSRYMLVEDMSTTVSNLFSNPTAGNVAGSTAPSSQYNGFLYPLINVSTLDVDVSFAVQADIALKLSYTACNMEFDLGYEYWGRSKEKICLRTSTFPDQTYALKGDAYIYGYTAGTTSTGVAAGTPVELSATESLATIHNGTNFGISGVNCSSTAFTSGAAIANPNIDYPQYARAVAGTDPNANLDVSTVLTVQTETSNPPVLISSSDFSVSCGSRVSTNKIFGNISYSWSCDGWSPFIGIGGEAEFGGCRASTCGTDNNSCAISQWGVWLKAGVGYE